MPSVLPIFLAYGDTSSWEIVVWLLAGAIGIIGQIATHKQKKEQQARQARSAASAPPPAATRHTGTILPRLYAMSLRMAPLPTIPMPGLDRTHHLNQPMRTKLHSRREVRDALIAQIFLQPAKTLAR